MKIPKKLKIGNLTYSVQPMRGDLADAKEAFGDSSVINQTIRISEGITRKKMEETFIHEIVHSVLNQAGYFTESKNEIFVKALTNGFYQVLKENKLLK